MAAISPDLPAVGDPGWGPTLLDALGEMITQGNASDAALGGKAPSTHTHAQSDVTNLTADLAAKAPLASPALTGTPTAPTQTAGNNSTRLATTAFVATAVAAKADTSHTHTASQVTDLAEAVRDTVGTALVAGSNITITVNDAGDTITIASTGGGSSALLGMIPKSGQYLQPSVAVAWSTSSTAYASGSVPLVGVAVPKAFDLDALLCRISTNEAGIGVRVLLYASDADGHPSNLVAHGAAAAAGAGTHIVTFTPVTLTPGVYWAAIRTDGGSTIRFWGLASNSIVPFAMVGSGGEQRNPVPKADVGTYASPATTLTGVTYGVETSNDVPYVTLRRD